MKDFPSFIFLGSSPFSVFVLQTLALKEIFPRAIITAEDKPQGRHLRLTFTPVRVWANENNIKIFTDIKDAKILGAGSDLFLIAAYGKILPKDILRIPKNGVINIHPSLLPKYRGPSPIQTALLNGDKKTGVTIMLTDSKMDHGPIISQGAINITQNTKYKELEKKLAILGAENFVEVAPKWISREVKEVKQEESTATYTKMITKSDGLVDLSKDSPELIVNKARAFAPWPGVYFFIKKNGRPFRVIIKDAVFKKNKFVIKSVKPEGENEMGFEKFKSKFPECRELF